MGHFSAGGRRETGSTEGISYVIQFGMYNLLFWIGIQLLLLGLLENMTRDYRNRKAFKVLFLPAVLLEGFLRLLVCFVSAKPVERIEFLEDQKPFLNDGKSRIPYFGPIIFLTLWQACLFASFYSWIGKIEALNGYTLTLPHVDALAVSQFYLHVDARSYVTGLKLLLAFTRWTSPELWLFLYLVIGLFPFFSLNFRQVKEGAVIVLLLGLFTAAVNYFGFRPGFLSRGWYISKWVLPEFFDVYSLFLTLLGFTVLLHGTVRMALRSLRAWAARAAARSQKPPASKSKPRQAAHA